MRRPASTSRRQATAPAAFTRRRIGAAVPAAGAAVLLAACGTGQNGPAAGAGAGGSGPRTITGTLAFWSNGGETDPSWQAWQKRIADFKQTYPQANVQLEPVTSAANEKITVAVAAGTPPDVAVYNRYQIRAAAFKGQMTDLMPMAKTAGIKGDDQQPWAWQDVFVDGKLFGLPYSTDARMVYVNATHLKQTGQPVTAPKTLDDFIQVARRLTVGAPGSYQRVGFMPWGNNWGLWGWGWLFGGEFYDPKTNKATLDHPKVIAALEWEGVRARELNYEAVEALRRQQPKTGQGDLFVTGVLSSFINSTSFLITVANATDLDWQVWAPPPPPGVGRTHTWSAGFGKIVPAGVKSPEASFALTRYLTDEEMQRTQNRSGRLPTIKSVARDPYWNTVDPRVKQFIELLAFSHSYTPILQSDLMNRELSAAEVAVAKGEKTARVALTEANQRVSDAIRENRPE
jgi:multiple sugar transport system substrate-binding protein